MGIAHGCVSTVILRAESPTYAGVFRQSAAFLGRTFSPNRSVGCGSLGVAQGWYIAGPLALKSMLRVKRHVGDLFIPQNSSERIVFRCQVNSIVQNARATHGGFLHGDLLRVLTARTRIDE
jgi:hypothetical protein